MIMSICQEGLKIPVSSDTVAEHRVLVLAWRKSLSIIPKDSLRTFACRQHIELIILNHRGKAEVIDGSCVSVACKWYHFC